MCDNYNIMLHKYSQNNHLVRLKTQPAMQNMDKYIYFALRKCIGIISQKCQEI